jgi:hypothetical protein
MKAVTKVPNILAPQFQHGGDTGFRKRKIGRGKPRGHQDNDMYDVSNQRKNGRTIV